MTIALIVFALLVIVWAIATCSAGEEDNYDQIYILIEDIKNQIELLTAENEKLEKELTILRNYIHFNNLECDVMAYYGRSDEKRGKGE